ncbi:MAG TPA: ATP-dependent DNA helicase RecG [Candidatus Saccharimonadales bacterium]|nr:ATP-dependent DNA helicase RecG [Candidatus Saccharimonadales bacterium]
MAEDTLHNSIESLHGIGLQTAGKLQKLGIKTVRDLIFYYPRRYDDYSVVTPIAKLFPGPVTIRAEIKQVKGRYVRRGMHITEAVASDDTGSVRIIWFNQPYRESTVKHGQHYYISGVFELKYQRLSIMNPSTELVSDFPVNTARIIPVYKETKGLNSRVIRSALRQVLPAIRTIPESLPGWVVSDNKLMAKAAAIEMMHFPVDAKSLAAAKYRLGFEEVFELSLASLKNKQEMQGQQAPSVPFLPDIAVEFVSHLPFNLTDAQRKVAMRIFKDMEKPQPMNRLVEGDVGSGKTVVAALASAMVLHNGHQVALMAPTELLARQHAETLQKLLSPLGYGRKVGLLVGGMNSAQKSTAHAAVKSGDIRLIVGTHALIQDAVDMHQLELIIIDEQHRFGVDQRKTLQAKAGHMPHVLSLTATPIPRSLALTLYGDLDISLIDKKPSERKPIKTSIVSPNSRAQLYASVEKQIVNGRQIFVVCPLISESDGVQSVSAEKMYETLKKGPFKHRKVGLLHGKMKAADKNNIMQQFVDKKIDILVSTTVVEVGVDVPNANVMIIEAADRFGLAQLHQLRGRVGRGSEQGFCYLVMSDSSAPSKRLRALESSNDGFKLAELDLSLRGPGAIYGKTQHGQLDLRVANLTDVHLIASARDAARMFIDNHEDLLQYPELNRRVSSLRAITNLN